MKILIVEDEPLIRKSLSRLLQRADVEVDEESTGKMALEKIKQCKYDRIVCDLMLTDITGFDIIEGAKIQYTPEEISSVFIVITAYSSEQVLNRVTKYNCQLIQKPFKNLQNVIDRILHREE